MPLHDPKPMNVSRVLQFFTTKTSCKIWKATQSLQFMKFHRGFFLYEKFEHPVLYKLTFKLARKIPLNSRIYHKFTGIVQ